MATLTHYTSFEELKASEKTLPQHPSHPFTKNEVKELLQLVQTIRASMKPAGSN